MPISNNNHLNKVNIQDPIKRFPGNWIHSLKKRMELYYQEYPELQCQFYYDLSLEFFDQFEKEVYRELELDIDNFYIKDKEVILSISSFYCGGLINWIPIKTLLKYNIEALHLVNYSLDLSNNQLIQYYKLPKIVIPSNLALVKCLKKLIVTGVRIEFENINSLTSLKELILNYNGLEQIQNITNLRNLEIIDLEGNNLVHLNFLKCNLTKLKYLNLDFNPIVPSLKYKWIWEQVGDRNRDLEKIIQQSDDCEGNDIGNFNGIDLYLYECKVIQSIEKSLNINFHYFNERIEYNNHLKIEKCHIIEIKIVAKGNQEDEISKLLISNLLSEDKFNLEYLKRISIGKLIVYKG